MNKMTWRRAMLSLTSGGGARSAVMVMLLFSSLSPTAWGNPGAKYNLNISIDGTIVANGSCKFNNGGNLMVDFGEVRLQAGASNSVTMEGSYRKPIVSDFTCSGDSAGLLQMQLSNTGGTYKTYNGVQVLDTDKGIVGVELLVNGAAQSMGTWFTVDQDNPPKLEAELVQTSMTNSNNVVSGDTFTASGTLTMAFN
ncbi:fimbrial protein [Cronobacter turicensis]